MGKVSIASLRKRSDHLVLGDVCYFATPQYSWQDFENWVGLLRNEDLKTLYKKFSGRIPDHKDDIPAMVSLFGLEYRNFREIHNSEPEWVDGLYWKLKRYLRQSFLCTDPRLDAYFMPKLPYSGFGYHVLHGGLTDRVFLATGSNRLYQVGQLGFLHQSIDIKDVGRVSTLPFHHTRGVHVNNVRAFCKLILYNNNATEHELLLGDVASLTHDARTPAGSDSTKGIDPKAFNEDVHYPKVLAQTDFSLLPEISEEDKQELIQIILNRGKIGAVLDIADKLGYISDDTYHFMVPHRSNDSEKVEWKALDESTQLTSVWETVCIDGDKVFFTDKDRLVYFLEHRAMMFRELYQNPYARFWEQFVKTFVLEKFYKTGRITEDQLLQMVDWQLTEFINKEIGQNILHDLRGTSEEAKREGYQTEAEAQARKAELIKQGRVVCIIEKAYSVKAGAHFLVQTKNGLQTLKQADPAAAAHIHSSAQPISPFNVYYLDVPFEELPEPLRDWK